MLEYTVEHNENGKFGVCVNNYSIFEVYYSTDNCSSPISKEKAEEWANTFKCMVETEYPASELNEEDYESSISKMMKSLGDDEESSGLLKLMLLKSLME